MDEVSIKKARDLAAVALLEWDQKITAKDWKIEKHSVSTKQIRKFN